MRAMHPLGRNQKKFTHKIHSVHINFVSALCFLNDDEKKVKSSLSISHRRTVANQSK